MPDPFAPVQAGDPIQLSATVWNAMLAAAKANGLATGGGAPGQERRGDIVRVKNETGVDLPRRSVLGLGDPVFTPADDVDVFLREVTFVGATPATATHRGLFAVLLEPAADDQIVRAFVSGVCQVQVSVGAAGHGFADVKDGDTAKLESAPAGPARILFKESGTGTKWAVVRLNDRGGGAAYAKLLPAAVISAAGGATLGSGSVTLCSRSGATLTADGPIVTAYNAGGSVTGAASTGSYVALVWRDGAWSLDVVKC